MTPVRLRRSIRGLVALALLAAALGAWLAVRQPTADASQQGATGSWTCGNPNSQGGGARRDWIEVASAPNSYTIGNCKKGDSYTRVRFSDDPASANGWNIGVIGGSFDGCGVVKVVESTPGNAGTGTKDCTREPSQKRRDFGYRSDCAPRPGRASNACRWDPNSHGDVTTKTLKKCAVYANARPFSRKGRLTDPVGYISPAETRFQFRMRYVARNHRVALGFLGRPVDQARYTTDPAAASDFSPAPPDMPQWVFVRIKGCITTHHQQSMGRDRRGV